MKRLFTYITMLVLAVACETMYGPVQTPIKGDKAGSITVTVDEVKDNSVTFTVSPASESAYYSYMVQAGNEAAEVDATTLYSNGYKKAAGVVASASVKWTAEKSSTTVTVSSLASNTTYQIYAVAGSPMGFPGDVVNTSFKTSDVVAPVMAKDYESADSTITFTFNEPVVRGTGALTAKIYAMNSVEIEDGEAIASIPVEDEWIKVNGASVSVTVEGMPAGAFYTIDYPKGAFKDVCGNEVAAVESAAFYSSDTGWEPLYVGLGGRNTTKDWSFEDVEEVVEDWELPIILTPDSPYGLGYLYEEPFTLEYYEGASKVVTYELTYGNDYGIVSGMLLAFLPEEPAFGAKVVLTVPAEAFEDYFGNMNAEWEAEMQVPYDMSVTFEDIVGTYAMTEMNALKGTPATTAMIIEKSDDPVFGNVMLTAYNGFKCNVSPIYGVYDPEDGTLTFESQQVFAKVMLSATDSGYLMFCSNTVSSSGSVGVGSDPVVWYVTGKNVIKGANYYYGTAILTATGKLSSYLGVYAPKYTSAVLLPDEETSAFSTAPITQFPLNSVLVK